MSRVKRKKLLEQPTEVIKRWAAIKTIRKTKHIFESLTRCYLRVKLTIVERKRKRALENAFETIVYETRRIQNTEFHAVKEIFNISLYFLLMEKDVQTLKIDAITHPDKWKRNLYLRNILLVIYEWDMSKVAPANKMNDIYENAKISENVRKETSTALRKMRKTQSKTKKLLAEIRHSTIAHRDADALYQYRKIVDLDAMEILKIVGDFYESVHCFTKVLPELMRESGHPRALFNQYGKQVK